MRRTIILVIAFTAGIMVSSVFASGANVLQCSDCHTAMSEKKVIHAPVSSGFCFMCHDSIDSSKIPHVITSSSKMGLSYEGDDLCYACHEQSDVSKNQVHQSINGITCTSCHDPHASDNYKLLRG